MTTRVLVASLLLAAACGGSKHPSNTVGNTGGTGTPGLADGGYACEFLLDGNAMGPHHCTVTGGKLDKTTGFEPFSGTLSGDSTTVHVDAQIGCHELSVKCHQPFSLTLTHGEGGIWRGAVENKDGSDWWLNKAQFEIGPEGSLGGETYGGPID